MHTRVLVINLGWEQQPLIDSLVKRGCQVFGISNDGTKSKEGFEKIYHSDYRDIENIYKIAKEVNPHAIISDQCDYSHYAQAFVAQRLGLNGPSLEQAQISSNKYIQRLRAERNGIKVPNFKLATTFQEAKEACEMIGFPVIIKPIDNRGSFGVSKVGNLESLTNAYYNALVNSHSRFVLIEQFILGYEITVDGYCFDGQPKSLAIALKSKEGLASQVSMDIKYPADIPDELYQQALSNNELVIKALGYTFGMVHSEYLIDDQNKIFLVESANRGGGVFTSEIIVPAVSGIDILERYIDDSIGITSRISPDKVIEKNQVILKFFAFKNGKVKGIKGLDQVAQSEGVLKCRLNIREGDNIESIDNDGSRHGFVIYRSADNLRSKAVAIINKIEIEYENG